MRDFTETREILENGEHYKGGPGRECVVFYRQEQVFRHIAGYKDREQGIPLSGDELFELFSCTKLLTCTAAMMLLERGAYGLEEPVGKYLPEFWEAQVREPEGSGAQGLRPPKTPMLIRHLFTMSAGLSYEVGDAVLRTAKTVTEGACPTLETVRFLSRRPLEFDPGEQFRYSLCHDVLGALIQVWSGMSFFQFLKKEIFEPLGMKETFFHIPEGLESRKAVRYIYDTDGNRYVPYTVPNPYVFGSAYESGGAGIVSTLDDYARFVLMLSRGGRTPEGRKIIGEEMLKLMATPVFDEAWQETFQESWIRGYNYGLGVYVLKDPEAANSLAEPGTYGWNGAAGSYVSIDPEKEIAIFYIQHMHSPTNRGYHDRLRNAIYRDIPGS